MLYLWEPQLAEVSETYTFLADAIKLLNELCHSTRDCFVVLRNNICMQCGGGVRGKYILAEVKLSCQADSEIIGVIFLNEELDFAELCTVLIHEVVHHLTQQGHGNKLYTLYWEWLRDEFVRRWNENVRREKD